MRPSAESIFSSNLIGYLREFESICKTVLAHKSGDPGVQFNEKTESWKSRDIVPLSYLTAAGVSNYVLSTITGVKINLDILYFLQWAGILLQYSSFTQHMKSLSARISLSSNCLYSYCTECYALNLQRCRQIKELLKYFRTQITNKCQSHKIFYPRFFH
jgi:hypothetical protein